MSKVQLSDARSHKAAFTLRTSSVRLMTVTGKFRLAIGRLSVDQ